MSREVESDWRILDHVPEPWVRWVQRRPGGEYFLVYSGHRCKGSPNRASVFSRCGAARERCSSTYCFLFVISLHYALRGLRPTAPAHLLWSGSVASQTSLGTSWCSPNFSADDLLSSFLKHFSWFLQPNFLRGFLLLFCRFSVFLAYSSSTSDF